MCTLGTVLRMYIAMTSTHSNDYPTCVGTRSVQRESLHISHTSCTAQYQSVAEYSEVERTGMWEVCVSSSSSLSFENYQPSYVKRQKIDAKQTLKKYLNRKLLCWEVIRPIQSAWWKSDVSQTSHMMAWPDQPTRKLTWVSRQKKTNDPCMSG